MHGKAKRKKVIAASDITYCINKNCKLFKKCERNVGNAPKEGPISLALFGDALACEFYVEEADEQDKEAL